MIKIKEKYIRLIGIPLLAFIMLFVMREHMIGAPFWKKFLISLLYTSIYWNGTFSIFMAFRKVFPDIDQTVKRLIFTILSSILFILIGGIIIRLFTGELYLKDLSSIGIIFSHKVSAIVAASMVGAIYECVFFFDKWKKLIKQNEELKNQQIRMQFEVLQNQMSPHFLFNSLNTLTTLIAENQQIAIEFTEKLSEVYRYILQNKEKELIPLAEEISFSKSYIYLLQMRYPENLKVDFNLNKSASDYQIPPLTIQILLENCVKHNVISRAMPLHIEIYSETDSSIVVKNNLQPRKVFEKSTKTGLTNIKKRYKYLGDRKIDIISTPHNFIVAVPLVEVVNEKNLITESV